MISCGVVSYGILKVLEMAPEIKGCAAATTRTCPCHGIERLPFVGAIAQSKTVKSLSFTCGALSIVPRSSIQARISLVSLSEYPSVASARGIAWLAIFIYPPPTNCFIATCANTGSIPVESQSIIKAIVPVGAITDAWEFLTPCVRASSTASSQDFLAATKTAGSEMRSFLISATLARCFSKTRSIGCLLTSYPEKGPIMEAITADCRYDSPVSIAVKAPVQATEDSESK